jgi:hypothetical protein
MTARTWSLVAWMPTRPRHLLDWRRVGWLLLANETRGVACTLPVWHAILGAHHG